MAIVQVPLEIPDEIVAGLLSGEYVRHGGVVRDLGGHLVKLLGDGLPIDQAQEVARTTTSVARAAKNPRLIAIGLGVAVVVAGGVALSATTRRTDKNAVAAKKVETLTCVDKYNASLAIYLEAVRRGNLDVETVDLLIADLDAAQAKFDDGSITIDFSAEQQKSLVEIVVEHTRRLAEANHIDLRDIREQAPKEGLDADAMDLRHYLEIQSQIMRDAA